MRTYVIDELSAEDIRKVRAALVNRGLAQPIDDLFWIEVPRELLAERQREHFSSCAPFLFSLETNEDGWIKLELLLRSRECIRCACIAYADESQRAFAMNYVDNLLRELDIPV